MKNTLIVLVLIVVLGAFLRLFWLDKYPPGVTGDEIQQGYTGYSLYKTGKDEWGDFLPINPRGFGDYKPPLYAYLTVPFIAINGLNIISTRLPSAFAGILLIVVIYFLTFKLFGNKLTALFATFLVAISPWGIQYSRVGWESNLGVLTFALGLLFLLKSFEKGKWLILSSLFFGLTFFTYHSFKLFTVLFLIGFLILYRKEIFKIDRNWLIGSTTVLLISLLIVVQGYLFSGAGRRAADAAIYNEENIQSLRDIQKQDLLPEPWRRIVNNKMIFLSSQAIQNYLGYYSLSYLTSPFRSDASIFNLPGKGLIYIWEVFFLLTGVYLLTREKTKWFKALALWILLAPIPAALTRDYMLATRAENLPLALTIVSAYSINHFWNGMKNKKRLILPVIILSGVVILWSLITRVDYYLYHNFQQNLGGLNYGYGEIVDFTEKNLNNYEQIIFTKHHSEPQAFVAFYSQMDPQVYQQYSKDWKNFETSVRYLDMTNYKLGKYYFKNIDWKEDSKLKNSLIVADPAEVPPPVKPVLVITNLYGKEEFRVYKTSKSEDEL